MTHHYIKSNHIRLHCQEFPGNKPPILLMHGLTANSHAFDGLIAAGLSPAFQVYSVDLRGRGESYAPDTGYTMQDHAQDIIGLMDAFQMDKAVLGGHSFGGFLALYIARFYPDRVDKLILMDAAAKMHPNTKEMLGPAMGRLGKTYSSMNEYLSIVKSSPYLSFWEEKMASYYIADTEDCGEGKVRCIPQLNHMMEAVTKGSLGEPWEDYLQEVTQAAILINAVGNYTLGAPLLPEEFAMETVEAMKNCIYAKVPGNHQTMLYGDGAREIVSIIKHFLNQ